MLLISSVMSALAAANCSLDATMVTGAGRKAERRAWRSGPRAHQSGQVVESSSTQTADYKRRPRRRAWARPGMVQRAQATERARPAAGLEGVAGRVRARGASFDDERGPADALLTQKCKRRQCCSDVTAECFAAAAGACSRCVSQARVLAPI